jgi:peptide-methionine (S)-S-oxide reductase
LINKSAEIMKIISSLLVISLFTWSCQASNAESPAANLTPITASGDLETATFGTGCFWCTEAIFESLIGVEKAESGYSGGPVKNPTYKAVCSGSTGHAEVIQISYDPTQITFTELLEVFWQTHDPTTLNKQGYDEGTQYRSAIFYHSEEQKELAEEFKAKLDAEGAFENKIVTEITAFDAFYSAGDYHQDYFELNPNQGYCRSVIAPKMDKFKKVFGDKLKK